MRYAVPYQGDPIVPWVVQRDVESGRRALNFSEWQRNYEQAGESAETVREAEMPPRSYLILHSAARLSSSEKGALAQGLAATIASEGS